jgi:uncharacterized protein (DUF1015 family)
LHISKPEIDLPREIDPYDPAVYAQAQKSLQNMLDESILIRDERPCFYAYRLIMGNHTQLGLVATASVLDYNSNRIRKHEFTRPVKEDDRVRQIEAVNAQTGPVLLAYPQAPEVDEMLVRLAAAVPDMDVTADDGVRHSLWMISDDQAIADLMSAFDAMHALYIADGHHRSAAASRVCANRRVIDDEHTGDASYNYFLSVIFPHHQMTILDYNRVIKDLGGLSPDEMFARVGESFLIESSDTPVRPRRPAEFGMYLDGRWYLLILREGLIPQNDPVARLDVSLLATYLIEPILNIHDPRRDDRIGFVGGIRGLQELERRVDSGEMSIAFSLFPTRMEDLMAVADDNQVMPPKSTWFEPKLADGLVSHVLD